MRSILIATAALLLSATAANAETFAFTGAAQKTTQVTARDATGRSITSTFTTFDNNVTWASGKKSTLTGRCTSSPRLSRNKAFATAGECSLSDADGAFSLSFVCKPLEATNATARCAGDLTGESGAYQGRSGKMSWQATRGTNGASTASGGSGQWD